MALTKRKAKRAAKKAAKKAAKQVAKQVARHPWLLAAAVAILIAAVLAWMFVPAAEWIDSLGQTVAGLGAAAPVLYVILYILGTIVLAPSPVMSIAAGVAFGWWGLPLCVLAATAGATASFLLSRYFFDDTLEDWLTERPAFNAVRRAVDEESWRILLLLRLSPAVPFGLLNYLLGLTKTPLGTYVITTALGILPGSFVDIYIGVIGKEAGSTAQLSLLVVGLIATVAVAALITIKARGYLREAGVKV
jgi:uncharacterized membrane protein YdjX (TVP38/TMEM64 family)